ncbi:MAG: alpha-amylase family glycosyl hydrolase [Chloroflexota bacterium]
MWRLSRPPHPFSDWRLPLRSARAPSVVRSPRFGDDWSQRGIIYQIYPRSFADTDGDGVGDLQGIIDHLDHVGREGLGIDAIWLSPIYPSPGLDVGYDVSDHTTVDPLFGSDHDFDRLVEEAHARGIRIVLDLVMNHTSDQHPWFMASRASRTGPYAGWYLWRDPSGHAPDGTPLPPNNWVSFFGGPGWEWEAARQQFYFHTFLPQQPELDWRNPAVERAQLEMVNGWLDRGVDGFRLDVFNAFLKHPELLSNPSQAGTSPWRRQVHRHDRDQPDFPDLIARFRTIVDRQPGRMSVGELFDGTVETAARFTSGHHLVFDWELLGAPWNPQALRRTIATRDAVFGSGRWPTVALSNHDQPRHASRLAASAGDPDVDAVARAAAVLLLTVRGTPFLYYGEELGLRDVDIPPHESVDPPAAMVDADFEWWDRSRCRTPMPWSSDPSAGFTTGRPWLRVGPDVETLTVRRQAAEPGSTLSLYRRLIALRAATPALQIGSLEPVTGADGSVVAYTRETADQSVLVALNVSRERTRWTLPASPRSTRWRLLLSTADPRAAAVEVAAGEAIEMSGDEAVILEAVGPS